MKASVLAPLVSADPLGWFVEDWVAWAGRVTVRRLREDVERALTLSETDPEAFRRGGGHRPCSSRSWARACLLPARQAIRIDSMTTRRAER